MLDGVADIKRGTVRFVPAAGGQPVTVQIRNGALMSPVRLPEGDWEATIADVTGVVARHKIHSSGDQISPIGAPPKMYFLTAPDRA